MKDLTDKEVLQLAMESGKQFLKETPEEEVFKNEIRLCIVHLELSKIMWYSLESYSKAVGLTVNELLSMICTDLLTSQDRKLAEEVFLKSIKEFEKCH